MSPAEARALAMAYELSRLLWEFNVDAWDRLEDVIGMLEPDEDDRPYLRLIVVGGRELRL